MMPGLKALIFFLTFGSDDPDVDSLPNLDLVCRLLAPSLFAPARDHQVPLTAPVPVFA